MERKKKVLTEVERRRVHVPEEAKVGVKVVGDELSAECCGNLWSKFKIPYAENSQTPDTGQRTPEIPNPRFSVLFWVIPDVILFQVFQQNLNSSPNSTETEITI